MGWKTMRKINECGDRSSGYIECFENYTYSEKDILGASNYSFYVKPLYVSVDSGIIHTLTFDFGMFTDQFYTTVKIKLNNTISYEMWIMDPKVQVFTKNPENFPRVKIILQGNTKKYVFLKV